MSFQIKTTCGADCDGAVHSKDLFPANLCDGGASEARPAFQPGDGGSQPTSSLQIKSFRVEGCDITQIRAFAERWHYSHNTNGIRSRYCFRLLNGRRIIGAAIFGGLAMANQWKKYAASEDGVIELRRLCCVDEAPKNTESYFIAKMLMLLRKHTSVELVISYADLAYGHKGIIYQASNFECRGETSPGTVIIHNGKRRVCKTPWREDRKPSLSVSKDGMLWKDFGEDTGGDAVCFLERACGLSRKDACLKLIEMAGCQNITAALTAPKPVPVSYKRRERPKLPAMTTGTDDQHARLAKLRGVSVAAVKMLADCGLLYFCEYYDRECWLITDRERINAQVRRLDGGKWGEVKALTLPNSWAKWPIGIGTAGKNVLMVEGGPDLLAACETILTENVECSPVCMFGAALEIHSAAIALFYRKTVRLVPHNDEAGQKAAAKWMNQLRGICVVELRPLPAEVKDLNDLVKLPLETRKGVVWPNAQADR